LDDLAIDRELALGGAVDVFLDRLVGDEPEDFDDLFLTDPVRAILRLEVSVRVPVRVEAGGRKSKRWISGLQDRKASAGEPLSDAHDDGVGRLKVEAETSGAGREDEELVRRFGVVEPEQKRSVEKALAYAERLATSRART
jgi:hypothetical protein